MGELKCSRCQEIKLVNDFKRNPSQKLGYANYCTECEKEYKREQYQRSSPEVRARRQRVVDSARYRRTFGITMDDYDILLASQDGRCAICRRESPYGIKLSLDHDHACCDSVKSCGKCIRALLCCDCNRGIGQLRDDPEVLRRAADYLDHWKAQHGND